VPTTKTNGVPSTFTGTAQASAGLYANSITSITYSVNGGAVTGAATWTVSNGVYSWTFTVVLPASPAYASIVVTATDAYANTNTATTSVPQVPIGQTFTFPSTPVQSTLGIYPDIAVTVMNNAPTAYTVVVFAVVYSGVAGASPSVLISPATVTVAAGATGTAYPLLTPLAHGTYQVQVFVYSTAGVPWSPTSTISVTV